MFDRAAGALIATVAAGAAAALAVFSGGFALFALIEPTAGPAGAAAIVALAATLLVASYALLAAHRARERAREVEVAQAELMDELPTGLGDLARERPMVTLAVTVLGGVLAARHPQLVRDVISIAARFGRR
jgi:hypothetical protein